jgi:hypothetical protein
MSEQFRVLQIQRLRWNLAEQNEIGTTKTSTLYSTSTYGSNMGDWKAWYATSRSILR